MVLVYTVAILDEMIYFMLKGTILIVLHVYEKLIKHQNSSNHICKLKHLKNILSKNKLNSIDMQ